MKDLELPYFDQVIKQLSGGDEGYEQAWGKHVHWGFWNNPKLADGSIEDFSQAADKFCFVHHELAGLKDGQAILDVGCGFGGNVELINEEFSGMSLSGLNIDSRQIERANALVLPKKKPENDLKFTVGNAVSLPYDDAQFDVVFALECIFHFPNRKDFIKEAYRVLKPGGRLVFSDFVGAKYAMPLLNLGYNFTKNVTARTLGHVLPFESLNGYKKLGCEAGFEYSAELDITQNVLPSIPVYKSLLSTDEEFVGRMFQTQARVSDSMKLNLVRFMIMSLKKL